MSGFTGTGRLVRLALRRDRVQLPVWIASATLLLAVSISTMREQFPAEADRVEILKIAVRTPALLMLRTVPTGASTGAMVMFQVLATLAVLAALMSTFAVIRHTRQNEETGRAELVGAMVVGRHANLAAALVVAVGANLVLATLLALTLVGRGEPATGSVAAGLAVGATGVAFTAIAAVAAQLTQTSRAANGIAAAMVGLAYLIRGFGDALGDVLPDGYRMTSAWPSWLSPIGWATQVRPFAGDRWWVFLLPLALFGAGVAVASALTARRDVGMGMLSARPGPATAFPGLLSPLGLAWRLQRGTLFGWAVALAVLGAATGSLGDTVGEAFTENKNATETITSLGGGGGGDLVDTFYAAMMAINGAMVAGYVVQALLRLRAEEANGPAEAVLATATGRLRWLGSHLVVAVLGAVALLVLVGVSTALVYGLSAGDPGVRLAQLTGAALVQLPAALLLAGFVITVFGLLPRLTVALGWASFAVSLVLGQLGDLLDLPQSVQDISPFTHIPALPVAELTATPLVVLCAVALALGLAGTALFRRRDLAV